jgi:hypothetical protein
MMGDVLDSRQGSTLQVSTGWEDCLPGTTGELIVDGQTWQNFQPENAGNLQWDLPGGEVHWALVTFRDAEGNMLALTNPIYFDGRN